MHKKLLKGVYFHTANKSFYNLNKSYRNFSVKTNKNKVGSKSFCFYYSNASFLSQTDDGHYSYEIRHF